MKSLFTVAAAFSICFFLANCSQDSKTNSPGGNQNTAKPESSVNDNSKNDSAKPGDANNPTLKTGEKSDAAKSGGPDFKDFPAGELFSGKTAALKLTDETREFRTRLTEAAAGKPNFAGHYIVASWGCGTDCVMGGLIDAKTGDTYMIPFTVCCVEDLDKAKIEFRVDSSLIIFNGLLDEKESDTDIHYYKFENGKFTPAPGG